MTNLPSQDGLPVEEHLPVNHRGASFSFLPNLTPAAAGSRQPPKSAGISLPNDTEERVQKTWSIELSKETGSWTPTGETAPGDQYHLDGHTDASYSAKANDEPACPSMLSPSMLAAFDAWFRGNFDSLPAAPPHPNKACRRKGLMGGTSTHLGPTEQIAFGPDGQKPTKQTDNNDDDHANQEYSIIRVNAGSLLRNTESSLSTLCKNSEIPCYGKPKRYEAIVERSDVSRAFRMLSEKQWTSPDRKSKGHARALGHIKIKDIPGAKHMTPCEEGDETWMTLNLGAYNDYTENMTPGSSSMLNTGGQVYRVAEAEGGMSRTNSGCYQLCTVCPTKWYHCKTQARCMLSAGHPGSTHVCSAYEVSPGKYCLPYPW